MFGRRHRAERSMNSLINDNLTGSRVVKSFGQEKKEIQRQVESYKIYYDLQAELVPTGVRRRQGAGIHGYLGAGRLLHYEWER